jgi:hypothetical protein
MGWEGRGGSRYYYRKERDGAHVRSVYVGRGEIARLEAALLALRQAERPIQGSRLAADTAPLEAFDRDLDAISGLASKIVEAVMISAGFHQHKRQWRKRRV